jgi:hypothetical protein
MRKVIIAGRLLAVSSGQVGKWGAMGIHRFVSGPLYADDSQSVVKSVSVGQRVPHKRSAARCD